ncbi:3-phytase [Caulobacter segnis]|uniref:3-phytase n=2 Tax=Caulobacter segnis TaxID=88688 RepID=D5VH79_CAUST|nr:phytase [Caulobacter segnis]ADG10797.1 3-phytase [Caulobacter segnis ATCC 21756]AVQ02502.1 3-phytase [Caulobacter segnis]
MDRLKLAASLLAMLFASPALAQSSPSVGVLRATAPTAQGGANGVALLRDPKDPARSTIAASGKLGGLELYALNGQRLDALPGGEIYAVDTRDDGARALIAALDRKAGRLRLFARDYASGATTALDARPLLLGYSGEGLCLHRSARDNSLYAFAMGREGQLDQWLLFETADGKLDGRVVRRLHLSSEAKFCVADDASGALYVAQKAVGIWRYDADPEAEPVPAIVDINRLGQIAGEVEGLAVINGGKGADYLIAANPGRGDYNVYDRSADDRFVGGFRIEANGAAAVAKPSGLFGLRAPLGDDLSAGALLVADDRKGGGDSKIVSWAAVAAALKLPTGVDVPSATPSRLALVRPVMETEPVDHDGDAADDPAIWVHPTDPAKSAIIATDKKGGMLVYDLTGKRLQYLPDGKMNNVDLRGGFKLGGKTVTLVAASDRTHKAIALYTIDPETRLLTSVADGVQATNLSDPYGLCMYRDRKGATFVFISDPDGLVRQWRLSPTAAGKVRAEAVRDIRFDSQTEGCVADDETGALYVAEEDVALWRLGADPKAGGARKAIARVADSPALKDDLEGVGLYAQPKGKGYLVVSSQGDNSYAVFRRDGDNAYVGSFAVTANGDNGVDGISETDGLDVTSASLGAGLEAGAFVAQDGRNIAPPEHQNFKLVPWSAIAAKLKL